MDNNAGYQALKKRVEELKREIARLKETTDFTENDARLATAFGEITAIALQNSQTLEALEVSERALRESEKKYPILVEDSIDAIAIVQGVEIKYANQSLLRLFGSQKEEDLIGHPFTDFVAPQYRNLLQERGFARERGEDVPSNYEFKALRKDGTEFDAEILVGTTSYEGKIARQTIIRDISQRHQAEEALRESEMRYRALFEQAPDSIVLVDAESGALVEFNDKAHKTLGYTRKEFATLKIPDFDTSESPEEVAKHLERTVRRGADTFETKHKTKDGETRDILVSNRPLSFGGRDFIQSIWRDITEPRRAEKALRESEERFRDLWDNAPVGYHTLDTRGVITNTNQTEAKMLGYTRKEMIGRPIFEFILPEQQAEARERFQKKLSSRRVKRAENRTYVKKDGSKIHVAVDDRLEHDREGKVTGIRTTMVDLTKRTRAAEKLRVSEQRYRDLYENAPSAYFSVRVADRSIVGCNREAERLLGYSRKALRYMKVLDLYPDTVHGKPKAQKLLRNFLKGGSIKDVELQMKHRSGNSLWVSLSVVPVKNEAGDIMESRSMAIDITERKHLEAQLIQAQKYESLGALVAGIAHEINNPVNSIILGAPLLEKIWHDFMPVLGEYAKKDPHKKYGGLSYDFLQERLEKLLADVNDSARRIGNIVSNLKNFARPSQLVSKKLINTNAAIENALRLSESTIRKSGVEINLDLKENLPPVEGDLQSIEQIAVNLILNAVQAIEHDKGKIEIATQYDKKRKMVVIQIADNGKGIDPSISERIFDPFITTRQAEGGSGLGLSVTYSLLKAHRGEITFKSKQGGGTTFTVSLPVGDRTGVQ